MTSKDHRLYGKFTLDFPDSPKIAPLSDAAFRALVEMTLYSRRMLTDGFIAERLAVARWGLDVCQELLSNDSEKPSLIKVENGYQIHDFADHQSTKAEIERVSKARKAAGRKGGLAKAKAKAKPTPSKTYPETETETDTYSVGITPLPPDRYRGQSQRGESKAVARMHALNATAVSGAALAVADGYREWTGRGVDSKTRDEIAREVDPLLADGIDPAQIAAGIKAWHASDSWSPTQLRRFVVKAARPTHPDATPTKATLRAVDTMTAAEQIIAEMREGIA